MSQEKVDKYKKEKYNRKHAKKKSNFKKIAAYVAATVIAIVFIIYIGYSFAVSTGLYTPPTTTTHVDWSDDEIESLRNTLIQNGDTNVKGETEAATTEAATTQAETTVEETTTSK
ncbi:MAG: hypothetical protein ACLRZ9_09195 [Eubacterium sp.]